MSDAPNDVGKLESAALARKERLARLRAAKEHKSVAGKAKGEIGQSGLPRPIFRSYIPDSEVLKDDVILEAKPGDISQHVKDEIAQETQGLVINELDFISLAPRKPDWDLKRDVAPKLDKLERRTQKTIAELIRERLKEDLASAVIAGSSVSPGIAENDD